MAKERTGPEIDRILAKIEMKKKQYLENGYRSGEDAYWQAYIDQMIEAINDPTIPRFEPFAQLDKLKNNKAEPKAKDPIAKQAVRLVEEFEKSGRKVTSLTIKGDEIKLEI